MRLVKVFEHRMLPKKPPTTWVKVFVDIGAFHAYGVATEEYEQGVGPYTTAIVEMEDGTVRNVPVEDIEFIDSPVANEIADYKLLNTPGEG